MNRAYALLEVRAVDEDAGILEGVASSVSVDRMEDVVEPKGATFKLPLPLLWQHDKSKPIGKVLAAQVSGEEIRVKAQIARGIAPYIDEAWALIKAGLVRGLSIGFRPVSDPEPIKGSFGMRFTDWEWLELSAVTIPANADANITSIKAADQVTRAASGENAKPAKSLPTSPGAAGTPSKGKKMPTTQERISALENSRAAHVARMQALSEKAAEEGRPFDESEQQEFDGLDVEVKQVDAQLVRDRRMAELAVTKAVPITTDTGKGTPAPQSTSSPILFQRANLEKGIPFARYVKAMAMARGNMFQAHAIAENHKGWRDTSPQVAQFLKAAVAAGTTTASAWADDLVYAQNLVSDFVDLLRPATIVGRIPGLRRVPFNIRVGTKTSGGTAYWVGEGKPIPLSKLQTNVLTLGRTKIAGMMSITRELAMDSSPSAEMLVRDDLRDVIVELMDTSFIDPTRDASANVSPASVTYGVSAVTRSGTNAAALRTDVATLFGNFITADIPLAGGVWIMTQTTAVALSMMQNALGQPEFGSMTPNGGTFLGYPAIVSQAALMTDSPSGGNLLIFLIPSEIMLADDGGVDIEVSGEASIQMSDAPNNDATSGTGQSLVSMFQTDSVAIRAIRHVNWGKRRTGAVQFIDDTIYSA